MVRSDMKISNLFMIVVFFYIFLYHYIESIFLTSDILINIKECRNKKYLSLLFFLRVRVCSVPYRVSNQFWFFFSRCVVSRILQWMNSLSFITTTSFDMYFHSKCFSLKIQIILSRLRPKIIDRGRSVYFPALLNSNQQFF